MKGRVAVAVAVAVRVKESACGCGGIPAMHVCPDPDTGSSAMVEGGKEVQVGGPRPPWVPRALRRYTLSIKGRVGVCGAVRGCTLRVATDVSPA